MNDKDQNDPDELLEELARLNRELKSEIKKDREIKEAPIPADESLPSDFQEPEKQIETISEEQLSSFIIQQSQQLIQNGIKTISDLQETVAYTEDAEAMAGFAAIIKATTGALDTLNAINIQREKTKSAKKLKKMDIEAKKDLLNTKAQLPKGPSNTIGLIATRETVMKMLEEAKIDALLKNNEGLINIENAEVEIVDNN